MQGRRGATRRDLPVILLFYGVCVWGFAVLFACMDMRPFGLLASGSPLQTVSGTVQRVFHEPGSRGRYFNLIVLTPNGPRHLTDEDFIVRNVPEAHDFAPGDAVTAKVRHQSLHKLDWCWELSRNGTVLLTVDQTERSLQMLAEEHKRFSHKFDLFALIWSAALVNCAFVLRLHFGGWFDKRRSLPGEKQERLQPR
jgi:hypothetical protein